MFSLSDNYYHRKCYIKRDQVPTQSVMKDRMSPPLANVYFKDMIYKLKVLAGLEPPLRGGGVDWYQPPDELLKGRAVLQPVDHEYLVQLGTNVINVYGDVLKINHQLRKQEETRQALADNDNKWKEIIINSCKKQMEDTSFDEAKKNTQQILKAFWEFQMLYTNCTTKIDNLLKDASQQEMQRVLDLAYEHMSEEFKTLVKKQATMLYDRYTARLDKENARMKAEFIMEVTKLRTELGQQIHDINLEKHTAVEKVRHLLECQNLACQVYVALKERDACNKELELSKHYHKKKVRNLTDEIILTDYAIRMEEEREQKRQEFIKIWKKKICHVIKKFQIFVEYCLRLMPQHLEFFTNMEALMVAQLNDAAEDPNAPSLFESEEADDKGSEETFRTPQPRPHPFYLYCDQGYKPQPNPNLCPKHCTSSASHMPVIVVNKQCIYSACDNFEQFIDKITQYIQGEKGDAEDVQDDHDYTYDVPVKHTMSTKLEELKLESSLMQILQEELPNVKKVRTEYCVCRIPYCFCGDLPSPERKVEEVPTPEIVEDFGNPGRKIEREAELTVSREPKWESYMDYVLPKKCKCPKTTKKHLREHIPPYMRIMSKFEPPELPQYETCPLPVLKKLVKKARKVRTPPPPPPPQQPKSRDAFTQYDENDDYDAVCNCFSNDEVIRLFDVIMRESTIAKHEVQCDVVKDVPGTSKDDRQENVSTDFATDRELSIKNLLLEEPELRQIFKVTDCKDFD